MMSEWGDMYQDWLEASYQYYILNVPTKYSDYEYDLMANKLSKVWDKVDHTSKGLIDEESLRCGSAFHIKADDYPEDIKNKYA